MSREHAVYSERWLAILVLLVSGFIFLLDLSLPFGIAAEVSYLVLVLLSLLSHRKTVTYYTATVGTALTICPAATTRPVIDMSTVKNASDRILAVKSTGSSTVTS